MIKQTCLAAAAIAFAIVVRPIVASADPLDQMISPVSHPTIFEDPRHSTEIRPIYAYHKIDDKFVTSGGDAQVYAAQARFKIADDLSIIAVKDGIVDLNPTAAVKDNTSAADVTVGAKYSFMHCDDRIVTAGLTYEIPLGDKKVFQGQGDGAFNPFISAGMIVDNWNFIAQTGIRWYVDNDESSFYDLNLHASYKIGNFYPLVEFGMNTVIHEGNSLPIKDEGEDFFNFGAANSAGKVIPVLGVGARYRVSDDLDLGAIYQFPVDRHDGDRIIDYRVTTDLIYRFSI